MNQYEFLQHAAHLQFRSYIYALMLHFNSSRVCAKKLNRSERGIHDVPNLQDNFKSFLVYYNSSLYTNTKK